VRIQQKKNFLFEKKKQTNFAPAPSPSDVRLPQLARSQTRKSFLLRFFKKELLTVLLLWLTACLATPAAAQDCSQLEGLYPQPGRHGAPDNSFRPLPLFVPARPQAGAPGTLALSILVDHVSTAPKGKPGYVWVGNYPVTDIPVFKLIGGASGTAMLVNPETGAAVALPNACLGGANWGFGGSQWALTQGDTLDVMLQSRLDYTAADNLPKPTNGAEPCRSSNLHTHGLLVSPYHPLRAGLGPYGDYVLDVTQPRGSNGFGQTTDDCDTNLGDIQHTGHGLTPLPLHYNTYIPGTPGVSSLASGQHPSGLFWYHPHPHGFAQFQEHGGTTGVITIGNLTDYACPSGDGTPGHCNISNANIRVMALKDTPLQSYGDGLYATIHDIDSGSCAATGGERRGECQVSDSSSPAGKWVFTINGVEFPVIRVAAGRMEIWRIVNASPSVTYRLSIDPENTPGVGSLPFQVLARDGVAVGQIGPKTIMHRQVLIMPASRIEIAIPAPPAGGAYRLHNNPADTSANGYTSGDIWPSVDLARIIWPRPAASAAAAPAADVAPVIVSGPATPVPHGSGAVAGIPPECVYETGDTRVIYFVHRFVVVNGSEHGPGARAHTPGDPPPNQNEVFGLIAGIRHADGTMAFHNSRGGPKLHSVEEVWSAGAFGQDIKFPGLGHNDYNTVCTVKGNVERWELVNWTAEDHNFHLHQTKFTVDPNGDFQFPKPRASDGTWLAATDTLIRDFVNIHELSFNDTVPVPRGQSLCEMSPGAEGCAGQKSTQCDGAPGAPECIRPGKMTVLIDFTRAEQVGTFLYHCHILEHEDGGMMAEINVICPPGDTSCAAQQAQASICRPTAPAN